MVASAAFQLAAEPILKEVEPYTQKKPKREISKMSSAAVSAPQQQLPIQLGQANGAGTSPSIQALKNIREALKACAVSPAAIASREVAVAASMSSEAIQQSVRAAESLKNRLMDILARDDQKALSKIVNEIEKENLCREALEISRLAAVVNVLRRSIATHNKELGKKLRNMIKGWRALGEAPRPASSNSSNSGTPSMISPAVRRGITPRSAAIGVGGQANGAGYAPRVSPADQGVGTKRRAEPSPTDSANSKKPKLSPQNGATASPVVSAVEAARQAVRPIGHLVASMGINIKPAEADAEKPAKSKSARGVKSEAAVPEVPKLRLKIRIGSKDVMKSISSDKPATNGLTCVRVNQFDSAPTPVDPSTAAPQFAAPEAAPTEPKKEVKEKPDLYEKLQTPEQLLELDALHKIRDPKLIKKTCFSTDLAMLNFGKRQLIVLPYIDCEAVNTISDSFFTL